MKKGFWKDFKEFAMKGNIIDMAVGVVIGSAFSKIVSSLVADVITPLISLITGNVNLTDLKAVMRPAVLNEAGEIVSAEVALTYGVFIQSIIDFLMIALSIFIFMRVAISVKNKFEEARIKLLHEQKQEAEAAQAEEAASEEAAPEEPSAEVQLLSEIRDLLKSKES